MAHIKIEIIEATGPDAKEGVNVQLHGGMGELASAIVCGMSATNLRATMFLAMAMYMQEKIKTLDSCTGASLSARMCQRLLDDFLMEDLEELAKNQLTNG